MSETVAKPSKAHYFSALQLALLNDACTRITQAFDHPPYVVGSSIERADWRDVDVRTILADDEFDAIFGSHPDLWSLLCLAVSAYLSAASGLPVDYQVQRQSEANEKFDGRRSAIGMRTERRYAGGGDATVFMAGGKG